MTEESVTPIFKIEEPTAPRGRRADLFAVVFSGLGALLSITAAVWFFLGFAENDTRPEHLASAFTLTILLFAFAVVPFACVTAISRRAYSKGTKRAHLYWTLFLMLPWIGLGLIATTHTPLPLWCGAIMAGLAALLTLWALVSLILDRNLPAANTYRSQENEMSATPE